MKQIRWVIAHEPIDLFLRAAERFSNRVRKETKGALDIEILSLSEYSKKYNNGEKVTKHDLLGLMGEGKVEASQMYTTWLGEWSKDMWVLDMPFLFKDHDHADRVLEGDIGESLLESLTKTSPVRGLAFTYSGGYRVIPSLKEIDSVEAFKGMKIRTARSPVAADTFRAVGAEVVDTVELEEMNQACKDGVIEAGESTFVRILPLEQGKTFGKVNDTAHSLFLTSIIIGTEFWNTLDEATQKIMKDAALEAARLERKESVEQIDEIIQACEKENVQVHRLSDEETSKFKKATESLYDKYKNFFSKDYIERIMVA